METPVDLAPRRLDDHRWIVESPIVQTAKQPGFDQLLASWNIDIEPGAAAAIELSVTDGTDWSPRLRLGCVGESRLLDAPRRSIDTDHPEVGLIDTDYFKSNRRWRSAQLTVILVGPDDGRPPGQVRRLSLCMSNTLSRVNVRSSRLTETASQLAVNNPVPFRSQATGDPSLAGRLCSPTSVAMVLAYRGIDRPVGEVAARAYGPASSLYGNWPNNIHAAYSFGVPGFLARFNDWTSVAQHLAAGEPLIASIRAPRGVIRAAPYRELDNGHLIVLCGLDGRGGVFVKACLWSFA